MTDVMVEDIRPGSGRISVTARIRDIDPGEWLTSAEVIDPEGVARDSRGRSLAAHRGIELHQAGWSWSHWSLRDRADGLVTTCLAPAIKVPGMIPYIWGPMVLLGIIAGLLLQLTIVSREHLSVGRTFGVSVTALIAGAVGAKLWYMVLKRREGKYNGWCIQGFLLAFEVAALAMAGILGVPIGMYFDVSTPGIFLGAGVGRLGCLLAGCCSGRPTTSHWGLWSSDQWVGRRRIPTQLMEAGFAAAVSLAALLAILRVGPGGGTLFIGSVAAYILCRQGLLRLRAEQRVSVLLGRMVTAAAAAVVVGDLVLLAIRAH